MDFKIKIQGPVSFFSGLVFVLFSVLFSNTSMATPSASTQDSLQRRFTVAKVYLEKYSAPGTTQVTFYESAQFYRLEKTNPKYKEYVALLKEALKKRKVVVVTLAGPQSTVIRNVQFPEENPGKP